MNDYFVNPINQIPESVLDTLIDSLLKILTVSTKICARLAADKQENGLVGAIKKRLKSVTAANAKLSLLRVLLRIRSQQPQDFLGTFDLLPIVKEFAISDSSVLVKDLAKTLLEGNEKS